ncbi:hypothetical protein IAT40_004577 [Kwoniella sp. CBS 6097]
MGTDDYNQGDGASQIKAAFESMPLKVTEDDLSEYVKRPGFGIIGRPITVAANMYPVRYSKSNMIIYHYDINIQRVVKVTRSQTPGKDEKKKDENWQVWKELVKSAPAGSIQKALQTGAYDQFANFYTSTKVALTRPQAELGVTVPDPRPGATPEQGTRYRVTIQLAQEIDLGVIINYCKGQPMTAAMKDMAAMGRAAINVLLRQDLYDRFQCKGAAGRRFYTLEGAAPMSSGGLVLNGFIQSFLPVQAGHPAIQLDTAYGPFFRSGNLVDLLEEILGLRGGGGGDGRGGFQGGRGGRGGDRGGRGGFQGRGGMPEGGGGGQLDLESALAHRMNDLRKLRNAKFNLTYRISVRPYSIEGFTDKPADQNTFTLDGRDGKPDRTVSVVQYFHEMCGYTIRRPRLPMVLVKKEKNKKQWAKFPMECVVLCDYNAIPFAAVTSDQTADMIKIAAKPPPERERKIKEWRTKINYSKLPKLAEWGIQVHSEMMKIPARVLPPPQVQYGGGRTVNAARGSWNVGGVRFVQPGAPLKAWSIVNFDRRLPEGAIQHFFARNFIPVLNKTGCPVQQAAPPISEGDYSQTRASIQQAARNAFAYGKSTPQILFVIVPRKDLQFYSAVERIAATELVAPVVTQLMQSSKITNERGIDQYCGNMSMKVHSKLGGITHQVPIPQSLDKSTMMIGADVSHPPQTAAFGGPIHPSIAVTVAAVDGKNNRFTPCIRLQQGRTEMIADLKDMITMHILLFEKNTGKKPEKVIMFRDGVSEGQYGQCATTEMDEIRKACVEMDPKYKPKITFVVCAKRHHMRFFATSDGERDRTGNLPPGTCVDKDVTHPYAFDFYLQAHAGLQGTARPTHYVCIVDEIGLCYSYARSAKAVSLIPVAYYADIIAGQARFMISDDAHEAATASTHSSGPVYAAFDQNKLRDRLESQPHFNHIAWYM